MNILALSGSLRAASANSAFCRAAVELAPPGMRISAPGIVGELPLFNPDLEACPPAIVVRFRSLAGASDALIIASPEYAHGISGAMKNALDWLVSCEGTVGKPVLVVNTSPRAHHAHDALCEILRTMSMQVIGTPSLPLPSSGTTREALLASRKVRAAISGLLETLWTAIGPSRLAGRGSAAPDPSAPPAQDRSAPPS